MPGGDAPMDDAIGPVFVGGCPRSGTKALSWAIAAHPGYRTSAEAHLFYYLLRGAEDNTLRQVFQQSAGSGSWLNKFDIGYDRFLYYIGLGIDQMMRQGSAGEQWVDGSPENAMVGEALLTMFPKARMFLAVRDPRFVCLSMLNSGFAPLWARDLDAAIREWRDYASASAALAAACPDRVLLIKQEDMRGQSAAVAAAIGDRLALSRPELIADFLSTTTINSSFDKQTYAVDSPFRSQENAAFPREEFLSRHGDYIMRATADLAEVFGYADGGGERSPADPPATQDER